VTSACARELFLAKEFAGFFRFGHMTKGADMTSELLRSILVLLVAAALRFGLGVIGIEIDPVLFNTIVAAIVAYIFAALGVEVAQAKAPKYFNKK
jgi:uncharacterized protein YacL